MQTYGEAVNMTDEELSQHSEVELCACAHPKWLHGTALPLCLPLCRGTYVQGAHLIGKPADGSCDCTEFRPTGLRNKNSLVSLPNYALGPQLYKQIPSCWSDFFPIYDEAVRTAPPGSILVEVGSFWGKSAVYLAEAAKLADKWLKVYCVDPWSARPDNNPGLFDPEHGRLGHIEPQVHAEHHNSMFETFAYFVERTGLSPDPLRVMRMESLEAAALLENASRIHFVFLDGDHERDYVYAELRAWTPMLMPGGFIAGHDWTDEFHGVKEAVTRYVEKDLEGEARVSVECGRSWVIRPHEGLMPVRPETRDALEDITSDGDVV
jgi:hypothetical protein